ncbi:MAG: hypothetical protein HQL54_03330 [Magnetococcales bacterium]|nr:hypothetical protein [Magnetococcales bacterium]
MPEVQLLEQQQAPEPVAVSARKHSAPNKPAFFMERARPWMMIDLDNISCLDQINPATDPEKAARSLLSILPDELQGVTCVVKWSSSQNVGGSGFSAHVYYWLDRPYGEQELKVWGRHVNNKVGFKLIDLSTFQTVQLHFTAAPIFDGMDDPLPNRLMVIEGSSDEVSLPKIPEKSETGKTIHGGAYTPKTVEYHLSKMGDGPGLNGFHRPLLYATFSYVMNFGVPTDRSPLLAQLRSAIVAAPKSSDREEREIEEYKSDWKLNAMIDGAIEKTQSTRKAFTSKFRLPSGEKAEVTRTADEYLGDVDFKPGANFIKVHKGGGKTTSLRKSDIVNFSSSNRVLFITFRRSLAGMTSHAFGTAHYLECDDKMLQMENGVVICADSLYKLDPGTKFDTVILDESEQIISHFIAETMSFRLKNFDQFRRLVHQVGTVVCLDADLSDLTFDTVMAARPKDETPYILINEYQANKDRTIHVYSSKEEVWRQVKSALHGGGKVYFATNSKREAKKLHHDLKTFDSDLRGICISSDTSQEEASLDIIRDVNEHCIKYDYVIATPSIVSGISIDVEHFTHVFGIFNSMSTTYHDALQALSRVRTIDALHVYLDPCMGYLETDSEKIGLDWIKSHEDKEHLVGISLDGARFCRHSVFEKLAQEVTAHQNESKNDFKRHFLTSAINEGYDINFVEYDPAAIEAGRADRQLATEELKNELVNGILDSDVIDDDEFDDLKKQMDHGILSVEDRYKLDRRWITDFYGEVNREIVIEDNDGRFRKACQNFFTVTTDPELVMMQDVPKFQNPNTSLLDLKIDTPLNHFGRVLLKPLGVTFNGDGKAVYDDRAITGTELSENTEFMKPISNQFELFKTTFGLNIGEKRFKAKPIQWINRALSVIGLRVVGTGKRGPNGREYRIDQARLKRLNELHHRHQGKISVSRVRKNLFNERGKGILKVLGLFSSDSHAQQSTTYDEAVDQVSSVDGNEMGIDELDYIELDRQTSALGAAAARVSHERPLPQAAGG